MDFLNKHGQLCFPGHLVSQELGIIIFFAFGITLLKDSIQLPKWFQGEILYSYFMPVCIIVQTITLRSRGPPDTLLKRPKAYAIVHQVIHGNAG